jgi:3-phenylpropionate/cinnamic acid dioxygenase small subunit
MQLLHDNPRATELPDVTISVILLQGSSKLIPVTVIVFKTASMILHDVSGLIPGGPNILKNGGDEAESETPFMVVRIMHDGKSDIFATGLYLDSYRVVGNELKFVKRVVVCDSSRIDTLMALPL